MMNGLSLGSLLGVIVWIWYRDLPLSLVIGSALTINFCSAALGGVLVPLTVKRMGFDPALAGAVILTTVKIGRAHVCTPVTNEHLVCRLLLAKKNHITPI